MARNSDDAPARRERTPRSVQVIEKNQQVAAATVDLLFEKLPGPPTGSVVDKLLEAAREIAKDSGGTTAILARMGITEETLLLWLAWMARPDNTQTPAAVRHDVIKTLGAAMNARFSPAKSSGDGPRSMTIKIITGSQSPRELPSITMEADAEVGP